MTASVFPVIAGGGGTAGLPQRLLHLVQVKGLLESLDSVAELVRFDGMVRTQETR